VISGPREGQEPRAAAGRCPFKKRLNGKRRRKGHDKKPPRWRVFGETFALPSDSARLLAALGSQPAGVAEATQA